MLFRSGTSPGSEWPPPSLRLRGHTRRVRPPGRAVAPRHRSRHSPRQHGATCLARRHGVSRGRGTSPGSEWPQHLHQRPGRVASRPTSIIYQAQQRKGPASRAPHSTLTPTSVETPLGTVFLGTVFLLVLLFVCYSYCMFVCLFVCYCNTCSCEVALVPLWVGLQLAAEPAAAAPPRPKRPTPHPARIVRRKHARWPAHRSNRRTD